jgi:hypothetical protein
VRVRRSFPGGGCSALDPERPDASDPPAKGGVCSDVAGLGVGQPQAVSFPIMEELTGAKVLLDVPGADRVRHHPFAFFGVHSEPAAINRLADVCHLTELRVEQPGARREDDR